MKNILLIGLIFLASISYGQQIQIREVGNLADLGGQIKFQVPAEDLARVRGKVLNEKGKPLQNANILICGTTMFFDGSIRMAFTA